MRRETATTSFTVRQEFLMALIDASPITCIAASVSGAFKRIQMEFGDV